MFTSQLDYFLCCLFIVISTFATISSWNKTKGHQLHLERPSGWQKPKYMWHYLMPLRWSAHGCVRTWTNTPTKDVSFQNKHMTHCGNVAAPLAAIFKTLSYYQINFPFHLHCPTSWSQNCDKIPALTFVLWFSNHFPFSTCYSLNMFFSSKFMWRPTSQSHKLTLLKGLKHSEISALGRL